MEPEESLPESTQGLPARDTFLLVPVAGPEQATDWDSLGRGERLARIQGQYASLDEQVRGRLSDLSVEYLAGAGSWIVRCACSWTISRRCRRSYVGLAGSVGHLWAPRGMVFAHRFRCDQNMWRLVSPASASEPQLG